LEDGSVNPAFEPDPAVHAKAKEASPDVALPAIEKKEQEEKSKEKAKQKPKVVSLRELVMPLCQDL